MSRQQQRTEETRARILEAAEGCFARYGYDATGVAEICAEAGLSKGAFYHHFASKHAVFMELLNRWLRGLDEQMGLLRREEASVPEALLAMAGLVGSVLQAAGEGRFALFLEFWSQAVRHPQAWEVTIAPYHHYRDFFASMIEAGVAEGSLQAVDSQTAARVIVSLAMGLFIQGLLDPAGADWEQVAREGIRVMLEGLAKR